MTTATVEEVKNITTPADVEAAASALAQIEREYELFKVTHQDVLARQESLRNRKREAEALLRLRTVDAYRDGGIKQVAPGCSIAEYDLAVYDRQAAEQFCRLYAPHLLAFDAKRYDNALIDAKATLAKNPSMITGLDAISALLVQMPGTVIKDPRARITSDLRPLYPVTPVTRKTEFELPEPPAETELPQPEDLPF